MQRDVRGLAVSTESAAAVATFDAAIEHYLKYHADTMNLVGEALASDPDFLMAHCLRIYLLLAAANPASRPQIAHSLAVAQAGAKAATPRERLHVTAAEAYAEGALDRAFAAWREILDAHPTDLLAFRICDTTCFRHGLTQAILEQADRVARCWGADVPGYDCLQTVWAFAHEEVGDTAGAERAVDVALDSDRTNYFAHHVKAHVFETSGRPREGCRWLDSQTPHWGLANNLMHHLWWHRALMELDLGDYDAALASYDAKIRNLHEPMTRAAPDHYVDLQNATALLWRLEQLGLPVGTRWEELADKAEARNGDAGHLLLVPHLFLALAATGRHEAAERYLTALRMTASGARWTAPAIAEVVIPVCEAILAHRRGDAAFVVETLTPRRAEIRLLGGSNAQRDMFLQMLVDAAVRTGHRELVADLLAEQRSAHAAPPAERSGYAAAARWLS
jgi:tetratricopeptide (TPR) repeat protein